MNIEVSVVVPFFNEEDCVRQFVARATNALCHFKYELVLVNDGSTDKTDSILKSLSQGNPSIRYLSLSRNRGQSLAVYCGFQHTKSHYVVMMDGDLQNDPGDIPKLLKKAKEGYDLVSGYRSHRKDSFFSRKLPSRIANYLLRKATGCSAKDMGGFKCLRGDIARNIHFKNGYHRLLPALVHTMGGEVTEIPIGHHKRAAGTSKYTSASRFLDVLFDIIMLLFLNISKSRPLYFFGKLATLQLGIAGILFVYLLFLKFVVGESIGGRPLLFVDLMLFGIGFITFSLGILSELILDIQIKLKGHSSYCVKFDSHNMPIKS